MFFYGFYLMDFIHILQTESLHWYYIMMTSSNGNIFRVTGHLCREFTGPGEFPAQRPVMRSFDIYFDLRLNKRLRKQSWGCWFETPPRPLRRHSNMYIFYGKYRRYTSSWYLQQRFFCPYQCLIMLWHNVTAHCFGALSKIDIAWLVESAT